MKTRKICAVMAKVLWLIKYVKSGLQKFYVGDFLLDDASLLGWPVETDSDQVKMLIFGKKNQHYIIWEIANILKISRWSVENHLHQLGYVHPFVWVPHKLSEENLLDHISACDSLLKCEENVPFFKTNCDSNEKWILYSNEERKMMG